MLGKAIRYYSKPKLPLELVFVHPLALYAGSGTHLTVHLDVLALQQRQP